LGDWGVAGGGEDDSREVCDAALGCAVRVGSCC
jgi:hypothetical protein